MTLYDSSSNRNNKLREETLTIPEWPSTAAAPLDDWAIFAATPPARCIFLGNMCTPEIYSIPIMHSP